MTMTVQNRLKLTHLYLGLVCIAEKEMASHDCKLGNGSKFKDVKIWGFKPN